MKQSHQCTQDKTGRPQQAYEGIRRMLFYNEIRPGQKVSYRDLAEKLGMSVTPVVQALKRLEHQGLVHYETNRGYFTDPMSVQEVEEIYELRELIEISLLPAIMENISNASLKQLKQIQIEASTAPKDDLNLKLMNDRKFHLAVATIAGRATQLQILEHLFDLLYLKYRGSLLFVAAEATVGSLHEDMIAALDNRDLQTIRSIMKKHFHIIKGHALKACKTLMAENG